MDLINLHQIQDLILILWVHHQSVFLKSKQSFQNHCLLPHFYLKTLDDDLILYCLYQEMTLDPLQCFINACLNFKISLIFILPQTPLYIPPHLLIIFMKIFSWKISKILKILIFLMILMNLLWLNFGIFVQFSQVLFRISLKIEHSWKIHTFDLMYLVNLKIPNDFQIKIVEQFSTFQFPLLQTPLTADLIFSLITHLDFN